MFTSTDFDLIWKSELYMKNTVIKFGGGGGFWNVDLL